MNLENYEKRVKISDRLTYKSIFKISSPSVASLLFVHIAFFIYGVLIKNFGSDNEAVSRELFGAYVVVQSYIDIFFAIAYITDYGGLAIISKTLGKGDKNQADQQLFAITIMAAVIGLILSIISTLCIRSALINLGVTGNVLSNGIELGNYFSIGLIFFTVYNTLCDCDFMNEKQTRAMGITIIGEILGLILGTILIVVGKVGIKGIGIALLSVWIVLSLYYLYLYIFKSNNLLQIKKGKIKLSTLRDTFIASLPFVIGDLSLGIIGVLCDRKAMEYFGLNGLNAMGAGFGVYDILFNIGSGITIALTPYFAYNYGAKRIDEIKILLKRAHIYIVIFALVLTALIESLCVPITRLFSREQSSAYPLIMLAVTVFSASTILTYVNFQISTYYVSINKKIFGYIGSFARILIFWPSSVILLPIIFKTGYALYFSLLSGEILTFILNLIIIKFTHFGLTNENTNTSTND